ncbi:hypothetical protein HDV00_009428, partial [Rhizophlyctis rosea]
MPPPSSAAAASVGPTTSNSQGGGQQRKIRLGHGREGVGGRRGEREQGGRVVRVVLSKVDNDEKRRVRASASDHHPHPPPPRHDSLHHNTTGRPTSAPPASTSHLPTNPPRTTPAIPNGVPSHNSVPAQTSTQPAPAQGSGGKKGSKNQKKPLAPEELSNMIQNKIVQLETETTAEEEEEKALAKAIKKASKDMSELMQGHAGDKAELMHTKYMELFQDYKRLERDHAKMKKKYDQANKDKDAAKADYNKLSSQKQKIETLCRELQKENKRVKEESKRLALSEQQKREELSSKFESTIWEIKSKMEEDSEEKKRRADDSELLKEKFKDFLEQYDLREKHFSKVMASKDIEIQLLKAKLEEEKKNSEGEERGTQSLKAQVASFVRTESELRKQLGVYVEKFKQVEETLNKSNELFQSFRKEMEAMTKKTRKLEKENLVIKAKCEKMNRNVLDMAEEKTKTAKALDTATAGKLKLEQLCRALQSERNTLRKRLSNYEDSDSQPPDTGPVPSTGTPTPNSQSDRSHSPA